MVDTSYLPKPYQPFVPKSFMVEEVEYSLIPCGSGEYMIPAQARLWSRVAEAGTGSEDGELILKKQPIGLGGRLLGKWRFDVADVKIILIFPDWRSEEGHTFFLYPNHEGFYQRGLWLEYLPMPTIITIGSTLVFCMFVRKS